MKLIKNTHIYAQRRYLWSGFWLIPTLKAVNALGTLHLSIGLLWWYWEVEISSPWLREHLKGLRIEHTPTVLIQTGKVLTVKFFAFRWHYEWWVMELNKEQ